MPKKADIGKEQIRMCTQREKSRKPLLPYSRRTVVCPLRYISLGNSYEKLASEVALSLELMIGSVMLYARSKFMNLLSNFV